MADTFEEKYSSTDTLERESVRNIDHNGLSITNSGISVSQAEADFHELEKELSRKSVPKSEIPSRLSKIFSKTGEVHTSDKDKVRWQESTN